MEKPRDKAIVTMANARMGLDVPQDMLQGGPAPDQFHGFPPSLLAPNS